MKRLALTVAIAATLTSCARPDIGPEPSLAPRAAEAIDPRVAVPSEVPMGSVGPALANRLAALVAEARAAAPAFNARRAEAERLASAAGPATSDSWIAAQLALSRAGAQHGVTTRVAADIDELAATRLKTQRWISPADREAIAAAAADVAVLSEAQAAAIARLRNQLAR